jgi:nucleoside-diphosphate-sugar epimerase
MKYKILMTGKTGFIGSNLVNNIDHKDIYFIDRDSILKSETVLDLYNQSYKLTDLENYAFVFIHLSTYFSKKNSDKEKIYNANIAFGQNVLEKIKNLNLKKIIYTNSMYKYYLNENSKNSFYSKTKSQFSELLITFCNQYKINYEEIFLDNTFALNDKRGKIISLIAQAVNDNKPNPSIYPEERLNLLHVNDVVKRLIVSISEYDKNYISSFVSKKSLEIGSIYNYLYKYKKSKNADKSLLIFRDNQYEINMPDINFKNIKLSNIPTELLKLISIK